LQIKNIVITFEPWISLNNSKTYSHPLTRFMDIWKEALKRGTQIDNNNVIYKGVKFVQTEFGVDVYTTETDFYKEMDLGYLRLFYEEGFDQAMSAYLHDKYCRQIEWYNQRIKHEVSGRKNNRRFEYLKKLRDETLTKLNYERNN